MVLFHLKFEKKYRVNMSSPLNNYPGENELFDNIQSTALNHKAQSHII